MFARSVRVSTDSETHLSYIDLARRVRAHLDQEHRYAHVVRVARCAEMLALRHGLDSRKARLAGMLHDLARLYTGERLIGECEMRGLMIDAFERSHPIVLHARIGACIAQEAFAVHDPQVLSAIEKHTTAAAEMSPLDCAVFLADGLEPGRDFPERAHLMRTAERSLADGMRATLEQSLRYLQKKGIPVAPQTAAAAKSFGVIPQEVSTSLN
ncbi:MAG TPA: bis(5'-nucleosyl)-tetraphosphatase (symmetrical) YqeK [Candidatus Baltobacteraceae bacterium]|nr:bis(5'-nucleosyl)-tetraphosphatase (symmetrical) YqeK [Candidatus Baltobacteraceae bacterium]